MIGKLLSWLGFNNPALLVIYSVASALIIYYMGHRAGAAGVQSEFDAFKSTLYQAQAQIAQIQKDEENKQRSIENQRAQDAQKAIDDAHAQQALARADAATAERAADGLRQRLDNLAAAAHQASGHPSAVASGQSISSSAALDMLANVLTGVERDGRSVAGFADQLRIAGQACERQYDALKPGV